MRLVMYSGGYLEENEDLNEEVLQMIHSRRPMITYIPSSFEGSEEYYEEFIAHFTGLGVKYFSIFHVDQPFSRKDLKRALKADAIYLSGGNTFYFLKHLRESGVIHSLQRYVRRGGVLMGESAGSIIMTPDINTAAYPSWDRDDNDVELSDLRSMNLVNFDFFPHYEDDEKYHNELIYQSKLSGRPIYTATDGSGIVVDHDRLSFIGEIECYLQGHRFRLK
jgi:dipeptidase E